MERTLNAGKRILSDEKAFEPATKASKTAETETPSTAHHSANKAAAGQPGAVPMAHPALVLTCAVSADKGTRTTMEDVHVCLMDDGVAKLARAAAGRSSNSPRVCHFAVYDGHGGADCARFVSQRLHKAVLAAGLLTQKAQPAAAADPAKGSTTPAGGSRALPPARWQLDVKAAKQAIVKGFTSTDELLLKECAVRNWLDGATAVAVWVVGLDTVLVANVGDAKCVLARVSEKAGSKGQLRGLVITKDHLAMYPGERARIEKAGGHVSADGRLNGRIQVSRAFGDAQLKPFGSSAAPDVTAFSICSRDQFLLCACDGFWGVMDPQGTVELVQQQLSAGKDDKAITNRLINEAVIERRCKDNCTVMLVRFVHAAQ